MATTDHSEDIFSGREVESFFSTIGIGPGLGQANETVQGFEYLLKNFNKPIVVDADALNILSSNQELQKLIPERKYFNTTSR
jgi:NAD(P)H-hydrate repair Nnr-like enzyme with NAD(P)H-hydrate dehydratase domain